VAIGKKEAVAQGRGVAGTRTLRGALEGMSIIFASKTAMVGLAIVMFWVIVAVGAPLLTPYTPLEQDWKAPNQGPSSTHILGTDELGRDLWSRLIYGARLVLVTLPLSEHIWLPGGTALWGVFVALVVGSPWTSAPGNTSGPQRRGEKTHGTLCLLRSCPMHAGPSLWMLCSG